MKAMVFHRYGSPESIREEERPEPTPKDDEIVIKVKAAAINPLDWHILRGKPFLARLESGLLRPKENSILGADVSGIVTKTGKNVAGFKPGDEVIGELGDDHLGGLAEYAAGREIHFISKPDNISFEEAAAMPVAALTAIQGIRDKGMIRKGEKVLVNGASGGVGHYAVQICKYYQTEVTGVCSTRNLEMVRNMGADHVIDYTQTDFTDTGETYDLIICVIGNRRVKDYKHALSANGRCVIIGFTTMGRLLEHALFGNLNSKKDGKKVGLMGTAKTDQKDLQFIATLMQNGNIYSIIDRRYPLNKVSEAIEYLETGHARGKVIITVDS